MYHENSGGERFFSESGGGSYHERGTGQNAGASRSLTETTTNLLSLLCAHGVQPESIYDMTYGECANIADAIRRRVRAEQEQQAMMAWKTAEMIGQYIAAMFGKNAPCPQSLYQAFPWIEQEEQTPDWREMKARMMARAEAHNARMSK